MTEWKLPQVVADEKTLHSAKHDLNCVSRAGGDHPRDTNEIGKWSGSLAQTAELTSIVASAALRASHGGDPTAATEHEFSMPELYSAETAEEIVPAIMERQVARLRALLSHPGVDRLPYKGGWKHIRRGDPAAQPAASGSAQPHAPPALALLPPQTNPDP
jgi:hypothetical protein